MWKSAIEVEVSIAIHMLSCQNTIFYIAFKAGFVYLASLRVGAIGPVVFEKNLIWKTMDQLKLYE